MNKYELYYQVSHSRFLDQSDRNRHIDLRASGILAFGATLVGLAGLTIEHWGPLSVFAASAVLSAFIVAGLSALAVLWVRRWDRSPNLEDMYDHLPGYDDEGLISWAGTSIRDAQYSNENVLHRKAVLLNISIVFLLLEGISIGMLILSTVPN